MSNNEAPNNEPKLVSSSTSSSRPKIMRAASSEDSALFWTVADLKKKYADAPPQLVPGFFSRSLSMIQGKAGSGKSVLALELVAAYTTGTPFLGEVVCNTNPDRPKVAYFDQDNFSHEVLISRLKDFQVDESKVIIPQGSLLLDDPTSYTRMAKLIKDNKVGLAILDSAHAFHKQRDRRMDQLRDGFKALIDAGTSVVILSHITKSGNADDSNAAEGSGLPAACDYIWGMTEVKHGQFRMKRVKARHGKSSETEAVSITYNGASRPETETEVTLEDRILQFIADSGEKGTNSSAIRNGIGGARDKVDVAVSNLKGQYYCDGKRGPGNHIWDLQYKPSDAADSSVNDDDGDDEEGNLAAA